MMAAAASRAFRRARLFAGAAVVLTASLVGIAAAPAAAVPAPAAVGSVAWAPASAQTNLAAYINNYRRANGLAPVLLTSRMQPAAQGHAAYMARINRLTHIGANGSNAGQRLLASGVSWSAWGENIAVGYSSSTAVFNAWRNSAGHRANMLNWRFTHIGIGVAYGNGRWWWCLVLARP
jgi:uncharacterized protein YkwD